MKALLLQGQDPNQTDDSGQYTPLIAAAFLAHIQVPALLLYIKAHGVCFLVFGAFVLFFLAA